MAARVGDGGGTGSARRRRERRLRSFLRHERMAVVMALSECKHHSSRTGPGGEVRVEPHGEVPEAPLPQGGSRPPCMGVLRGPLVGLELHFLEHMADICPFVQFLDAPVPQPVENVTDTLRVLDLPTAEQVIVVPKISCSPCPSRSLVPDPQSVDQLLEVPTVLSALRIAEQIVGIPVPRGRVQGFLPEQSSTATSSSLERMSERTVEQIVDNSPGGLVQGSASSAVAADEDFTVRWLRTRVRGCPPVSASTPAAQLEVAPLPDSVEWVLLRERTLARLTAGTDVLHRLVSRPCGFAKGMRREGSGTGTGKRLSVRMASLLFLLGEERYRQPRAVYKYWAPCRLCCVEILITVNNGHWFCHPRGTLLVLEDGSAHTRPWVYVHFRAVWTTIRSLSVPLVVTVSQMS